MRAHTHTEHRKNKNIFTSADILLMCDSDDLLGSIKDDFLITDKLSVPYECYISVCSTEFCIYIRIFKIKLWLNFIHNRNVHTESKAVPCPG